MFKLKLSNIEAKMAELYNFLTKTPKNAHEKSICSWNYMSSRAYQSLVVTFYEQTMFSIEHFNFLSWGQF